ncbi:vanin-like protein 3 [Diachasmimorpha longicaudata]|uniref:vanin-like protein 3 n=1 Tax=Diachasmimorpha longicaudata TaxID=58733 RepID=UPI0030B917C5
MTIGLSHLCLLGVLSSARLTLQASASTTAYYVGATVEYHPVTSGDNLTAIANENVKNYMKFLKTASENDVDIIVFPENSLTAGKTYPLEERSKLLPHSSYIPSPKDGKVPCHDQSTPVMECLKAISCAANRFNMYIAVNIREKEQCTGERCSKDGHNLYNTNVVFDRSGAVVARYRKYNLFGEEAMNKTSKPELSTFKTDFDVTFGQFICFDILYEAPALRLVRERKVRDILFSTHWFSELPFLTANQVQSAWSWMNDVNLLASGYNNPATGSGGSGIYAGKNGVLKRVWSEKATNAILISQIPKVIDGNRSTLNPTGSIIYPPDSVIPTVNGSEAAREQKLLSDYVLPYTTKMFVPLNGTSNATVCDRGLCCQFIVDSTHNDDLIKEANVRYYRYRFAVFNGIRSFSGKGTGGIEICGLIACTTDDVKTCATRFDTNGIVVHPTTFNSLKISGNFTTMANNIYLPINMNHELQPLNVTDFTFSMKVLNKTHTAMKYKLTKPRNDLMTFAIYGRNFTADGQPQTMGSSGERASSLCSMLIVLIAIGLGSPSVILSGSV